MPESIRAELKEMAIASSADLDRIFTLPDHLTIPKSFNILDTSSRMSIERDIFLFVDQVQITSPKPGFSRASFPDTEAVPIALSFY
jgi:hypothetical protein